VPTFINETLPVVVARFVVFMELVNTFPPWFNVAPPAPTEVNTAPTVSTRETFIVVDVTLVVWKALDAVAFPESGREVALNGVVRLAVPMLDCVENRFEKGTDTEPMMAPPSVADWRFAPKYGCGPSTVKLCCIVVFPVVRTSPQ
jgi:hypothetical protein